MRIRKLALMLCLIAGSVMSCEWLTDQTLRCPQFSYSYTTFKGMLRDGTIDQNGVTVELPPYTNTFGHDYVCLWVKEDPLVHFMFIPPDFLNKDEPLLKKTRAYRLQTCGNCGIFGSALKIFIEILIAGLLLLFFRSKLSNET